MICKYFLPFCRLPLHFVDGFLCCGEDFYFDVVPLFIFACDLGHIQKILAKTHVKESRIFMVSGLTFKSLIHFELIFVGDVK